MIHIQLLGQNNKSNSIKICFFFICCFLAHVSISQTCTQLRLQADADSLFREGKYEAAKNKYLKVLKTKYARNLPYYYTCMSYIRLSKIDSAIFYLHIGAKKGLRYYSLKDFEEDTNLEPLKEHDKWLRLSALIKSNTNYYSSPRLDVQKLFAERRKLDQKYRAILNKIDATNIEKRDSIWNKQAAIDIDNQKWLKSFVRKNGWPTISKVGKEAEHTAWLIIQHADNDVVYQRRCLKKMKRFIQKKEVDLKHLAYLIDRVQINSGKKQVYGTQFRKIKDGDSYVLKPRPIKDIHCVNYLRHYMGLPSLESYLKQAEKRYNINSK